MPVDAQVQMILDQLEAAGGPALDEQTVEEARELIKMLALVDGDPEPVDDVSARDLPGPAQAIPVRIYRPAGAGEGARPVLVWFHGGGWVIGDLDTADRTARKLANRSGAVVVSVDYRLAPEHPAPAAVEDCWSATQWVAANAAEIGADPSRIAVGGDSAGGNLAALISTMAVAAGLRLRHQLLVYPAVDLTMSHPSIEENGEGYLLTKDAMVWFINHYLGDAVDPKHPSVSPLYIDDLSRVAPATIYTAEYDPLRDEGEAYGARLADAGVDVEVRRFDGMIHGFFGLGSVVDAANTAVDAAGERLRSSFG
jgi:acetyl esterase